MAQPLKSCGYPARAERIEKADSGVVLLFRDMPPTQGLAPRALEARARLLEQRETGTSFSHCPTTEAYLLGVLNRLIAGSSLKAFASAAPKVMLLVQCGPGPRLPVARAMAGKLLLVPRALPQLAASEDAIAAVLAHELAHLSLRHAQRLAQDSALETSESETGRRLRSTHEREADVTGLKLLSNAGYDPQAAVEHLRAVHELAAAERAQAGAPPRPARYGHDEADARIALLRAQIRHCRYATSNLRTPVSHAVRLELGQLEHASGPQTAPVHLTLAPMPPPSLIEGSAVVVVCDIHLASHRGGVARAARDGSRSRFGRRHGIRIRNRRGNGKRRGRRKGRHRLGRVGVGPAEHVDRLPSPGAGLVMHEALHDHARLRGRSIGRRRVFDHGRCLARLGRGRRWVAARGLFRSRVYLGRMLRLRIFHRRTILRVTGRLRAWCLPRGRRRAGHDVDSCKRHALVADRPLTLCDTPVPRSE